MQRGGAVSSRESPIEKIGGSLLRPGTGQNWLAFPAARQRQVVRGGGAIEKIGGRFLRPGTGQNWLAFPAPRQRDVVIVFGAVVLR